MKKLISLILIAILSLTMFSALAEEANWAYAGMPLNNGNVGTIWYAKAYYAIEGVVNPMNPEYAPYTEDELATINDGAVEGAENYRFDVPSDALIGITVADTDTIYWYDVENAAAITGHADPLMMDAETGAFVTAEGEQVAVPMTNWAYAGITLNNGNVGTIWYAKAYFAIEGVVNPTNPEYAPYTADELIAINDSAVEGAENYRFDVPSDALIGVSVSESDTIFWYDAENAAAITGYADPLTMDVDTGAFATAEGTVVAEAIK